MEGPRNQFSSLATSTIFMALAIVCLGFQHSQAQFWVEDFGVDPGACANRNQLVTSFVGPNGPWTTIDLSPPGGAPNTWFVSATEAFTGIGTPGDGCDITPGLTNQTLHVGMQFFSAAACILCPLGDCGAIYDAGGIPFCGSPPNVDRLAVSPIINCSGESDIRMSFDYMKVGDGVFDDGEVWFSANAGTSWVVLPALSSTAVWSHKEYDLPATANGNPLVQIGFRWHNNDDAIGTDPSIAVDNISLCGAAFATDSRSACDSLTWIDGNTYYASNNTATHTIPGVAAGGCDSIIVLDLAILSTSSSLDVARCTSYTSPSGNHTWGSSGTYMDTLTNAANCDSVITINLSIGEVPTITHFTGRDVDRFRVRWDYLLPATVNDTNFRIRAWEKGFPAAFTDKSQFPHKRQKKFTGLDDNTWYDVKVGFACADGSFIWSATDSVKTKKIPCPDIGAFGALETSPIDATIGWSHPSATSFKLRYRAAGSSIWSYKTSDTNFVYLGGLTPLTNYDMEIKSYCDNGLYSAYGASTFMTPWVSPPFRLAGSNENFDWSMMPNPATDKVNLSFTGNVSPLNLSIKNVLGASVYECSVLTDQNKEIDLSHLSAGTYLVQVVGKDVFDSKRLIISE